MKISYVVVLSFSLVLNGCEPAATFDGTSPDTLEYSTLKVYEQLSAEKKEQLHIAITDIMDYYKTEALLNNDDHFSSDKIRLLFLNGKTADQIISEARRYRGKKVKLLLQYQQEK
ncbi:DUF6694 family lipoprotein [Enterobacter sp. ECC-019]|uniref:DUF6694 family lipoprotein n=1 Tax=Enterobacter sp. ECC-019 TaxID=3116478 RepID=UPI0037552A19